MGTTPPPPPPAPLPPPPPKSGVRAALEYTGIPASWLSKRPSLPSRNWLIFLSSTATIAGLYIYDRRQCAAIRAEYAERVAPFATQPLDVLAPPRRVTVLAAKWPGDDATDPGLLHFRKYVKPILVAAAVDYELVGARRHGDITRHVAAATRARRRADAGIDTPSPHQAIVVTYKPPAAQRELELAGGTVIVGRPTLKEYMAGVQRGWTESLDAPDPDEALARELAADGRFDEPAEPDADGTTIMDAAPLPPPPPFSPIPPASPAPASPVSADPIPPLPPLLLLSFTDYIGFLQIPHMLWDFFNERRRVREGAVAGYRLVLGATRPLDPAADLAFDAPAEVYYSKALAAIPTDIAKARTKYYAALPARLQTARELARGREPTSEESANPPPTEVELSAERMAKEHRWRDTLYGWEILRPDASVVWEERFRDAFRVFVDPDDEAT